MVRTLILGILFGAVAFGAPAVAAVNSPLSALGAKGTGTTLSLPMPHETALMVSLVEFVGGILFAAGIGSRLVSLILFVNMTVAYLSVPDDRVNFSHILSNPSDFYNATPYTYWFAALLILILGPGLFALDTLIAIRLSPPVRAMKSAVSSIRTIFK